MKEKKIREVATKKGLVSSVPVSHGVGRRKSSVARVWVRNGSGKILINTKEYSVYFHTDVSKRLVLEPLAATKTGEIFDIEVNVKGGGVHSQADAVKLGISRALSFYSEEYRKVLRDLNFLTVDSRVKERKKPGQKGARRKFQFVKR